MSTLPLLYHLMRADFLERTRRYSFLVTLGAAIYVAYIYLPSSDANYLGFSLGNLRGIYNSAWIGSIIAVLCSTLLILPGFYLVKNAITRDIDTRVGEIIATTPISKWGYTLGKTLSNFAFLMVMVAVLAAAGMVMQLIRAEAMRIDPVRFLAPILLSTLPVMLLISALAVLFETIPWLRGGFGNVVYACLWLAALIVTIGLSESTGRLRATNDPMGMTPIVFSMLESARQIYPGLQSGFVIAGSTVRGPVRTFVWDGATWTVPMVLGRSLWIGVSFVLVTLAALLFDRFDPSKERWRRRKAGREMSEEKEVVEEPAPVPSQAHLTPLNMSRANIFGLFGRTLLAELRIMLKGVRWWWYAVALGLIVAALFSPLEISRQFLLPAAWIWPILLWSPMGNREKRYRVDQLVFSVAHPLQRQLPAIWCAGFLLAVLTASGVIIRLAMTGHGDILVALLAGAAFIPSLALALGSWSGSGKLFEVLYLVLWYTGPVSRVAILDYMGVLDETLAKGIPVYYAALSLFLMGLAVAGWRRKV